MTTRRAAAEATPSLSASARAIASPSRRNKTAAAQTASREMPLRTADAALSALKEFADPERARHLARYFKTGKGEYGEGDRFLGVTVPVTRRLLRRCELPLSELEALLHSEWHEARLLALLGMVKAFGNADEPAQRALYQCYLSNTKFINGWDLVDLSAPQVVGGWLQSRSRAPLTKLAKSKSVWERRIAMLATFAFIRKGESEESLRLAKLLLHDQHDLIHKAVGWMLRELGKRADAGALRSFLNEHAAAMPRTALRYAIELLPEAARQHHLEAGSKPRKTPNLKQTAKPRQGRKNSPRSPR